MNRLGIILFSVIICNCRTGGATSDAKLVGGQLAGPEDFPATFIWTTETSALTQSYCTGSKVAPNWILTAAHCVLQQSPLPGETYIGPWRRTVDFTPGRQLTLSFARELTGDHEEERVTVMELLLPPTIEECLINPDLSREICQYREPMPDVALIRVNPRPASTFATTVPATIDTSYIEPGEKLFLMGYGSETETYTGPPRMKFAQAKVSTPEQMSIALQNTYATQDGGPNWQFFFGVASTPGTDDHINLGFGDSGGPVYRAATRAIIGVNSDGFCPIGNRDCSTTTNSTFARLDDRSRHGVGIWLRSILRPR